MTMKNRERKILKRFFVNESEEFIIKKKMEITTIKNFSDYARQMLLNGKVVVKDFSLLKELKNEINRIGVNINQIAKIANENQNIHGEEIKQLYFLFDTLENNIQRIIQEKDSGE